jgi:AMMECR1 domain-containing protein
MHKITRRIIETYLKDKKILTIEELGLSGNEHESTKNLVFVTLYKNGSIIASSGRIHLKKPNTLIELIENSLFCLRDTRFSEAVKNPDELANVQIRVDIIKPEGRRVL